MEEGKRKVGDFLECVGKRKRPGLRRKMGLRVN